MTTPGIDLVHGLRAAAKMTDRSPSGIQKMVDSGRVPAEKNGRSYTFRAADLEAIRRAPDLLRASGLPTPAAPASLPGPSIATVVNGTTLGSGRPEIAEPTHANLAASEIHGDGATAAIVFADLAAGHALTQIVVDRRLPPAAVRVAFDEWVALGSVDLLRTPAAETRLTQIEADVQALDGRLVAAEEAVREASIQAGRGRQEIDDRLRRLDLRARPVGVPNAIFERLDALELRIRDMPTAPLLLPERRCGCGHPLAVAACCPSCGLGRAPT